MIDELKFKFSFLCGILWEHWFIAHPLEEPPFAQCRWCGKMATEKDIDNKAKRMEKAYNKAKKILNV